MPTKFTKQQVIIIIAGIVLVIVVVGLIFFNTRPKPSTGTAVKLKVWGTEDQSTFGSLVTGYPYATVNYTQIDPANYDSQLLAALASGQGPDVFEISNRDLAKWKAVITPIPAVYAQQFGTLQLEQTFPDVVEQDFVSNGQIYGLPLSIDTLAMIYNKDLFNSASIAIPPKTWDDLDAEIPQLRTLNSQGQLQQTAVAIGGTSQSIRHAADLLSLLMLQNGTQMTSADFSSAKFASAGTSGDDAFNFYLQFANAASPYYTWDDSMGDSINNFVAGKTAVVFAYQSDIAEIKAKAPFLNVGVAAMPQAKGASVAINYPEYSGFVVAKAGNIGTAWNFIFYLTTSEANEKAYLAATGKPPALRADIQADMNDPNLSVFAAQALTAKSWYEVDNAKIDAIFDQAIGNVLHGAEDSNRALSEAEAAVSQLMFQ